jgi:carbon storage regulator CsrA
MLVLSRKVGEGIVLPSYGVTIGVLRVVGRRVSLGIAAPAEVPIQRKEVPCQQTEERPTE